MLSEIEAVAYGERVSSPDLLLHPVRLRIVKTFLGDRALTTAQIAAELADVPTGSLYRHIATLTRAGVLQVVAERRVRGTVEKTYTLRMLGAQLQPDEVGAMSIEDHAHAFMAYVAGLLSDFDRYCTHDPAPGRDGADYRVNAMWLTDAEHADFLHDLKEVLLPRLANKATEGRRRRMIYHVLLPAPEHGRDR
jgi:AcrR family transcriptional regulator